MSSFEVVQKKKISVPCDRHLLKEMVKKRRSKMFTNKENSFTENTPTEIDIEDLNEFNGKFANVIKGNLFEEVSSQTIGYNKDSNNSIPYNDDNTSQLQQANNANSGYDNPLLTTLLNELEYESNYENYNSMSRTQPQPVYSTSLLKTKGKKMDFSQKFANAHCDIMQIEKFQSKRSQI